MTNYDVVIIGGGASGMMAGISAGNTGAKVLVLEKNEKLGKKLYLTGKGRCNITNDSDIDNHIKNIISNPKFMMSALHAFSPKNVCDFFEQSGLSLKVERGNRVFPVSDKSSDVIKVLKQSLEKSNVDVHLSEGLQYVKFVNNKYLLCTNAETYTASSIVVATGGVSYPSTGSTGFGYQLAKQFGHDIVPIRAGLSAINLIEPLRDCIGLTLKNVGVSIIVGNKVYKEFGDLLFTHNGLSGPTILTMSSRVNKYDIAHRTLSIDLKPALTPEQLNEKILRELPNFSNKLLDKYLCTLMPKSLVRYFMTNAGLPNVKVADLSKNLRQDIINGLKKFDLVLKNIDNIDSAIITAGGIDTKTVNPKTMESKLQSGLYFAGEILDVDALTGGYNLQIAWSTGFVAGKSAARREK